MKAGASHKTPSNKKRRKDPGILQDKDLDKDIEKLSDSFKDCEVDTLPQAGTIQESKANLKNFLKKKVPAINLVRSFSDAGIYSPQTAAARKASFSSSAKEIEALEEQKDEFVIKWRKKYFRSRNETLLEGSLLDGTFFPGSGADSTEEINKLLEETFYEAVADQTRANEVFEPEQKVGKRWTIDSPVVDKKSYLQPPTLTLKPPCVDLTATTEPEVSQTSQDPEDSTPEVSHTLEKESEVSHTSQVQEVSHTSSEDKPEVSQTSEVQGVSHTQTGRVVEEKASEETKQASEESTRKYLPIIIVSPPKVSDESS